MSLEDAEKTCLSAIQEILNESYEDSRKLSEITHALHNQQILEKANYGK